jgi:hypothetical protein
MSRHWRLTLLVALLAALVSSVILATRPPPSSRAPRVLDVELQATAGNVAQLYWSERQTFTDEQSVRLSFRPPAEDVQHLRFPFPARGVRWLRFDPVDAAGEVTILKAQVLGADGGVIASLVPEGFRAGNQIASLAGDRKTLRLVTTPDATDPFLFASLGCVDPPSGWARFTLFGPAAAALASLATLGLLLASAIAIGRDAFGRQLAETPVRARRLQVLWLVTLFLVVFSSKLLLMRETPVTSPFWDQWDGEAAAVFIPASECSLTWRSMFSLHNEHRIFFSRLLALDLLTLNGQWDPRLEQVANAAVHSLTAVLLVTIVWLAGGRGRLDVCVFIGAVAFALPFAWENILIGFQSAFYFLLLFSVLAIWLILRYRAGSRAWFLGWACAVCGLFTAASGLVIPLVIAASVVLAVVCDRRGRWGAAVNLAMAACVFVIGWSTSSPPLAQHAPLAASTVWDFTRALGQSLAWPWTDRPPFGLVMWLPVCVLAAAALWRRSAVTAHEQFAMALALWAAAQATLISYGRGAGGAAPATRYMDFLNIGFVANAVALLALHEHLSARRATSVLSSAALAAWLAFATIGAGRLVDRALVDLDAWRPMFAGQAATVRAFTRSGNLADLLHRVPLNELPYPDPARLATLLQDTYVRRVLPPSVRAPVRVEPKLVTNDGFVEDGVYRRVPRQPLTRSWGSFSARGNPSTGRFESEPIEACQAGRLQFQVAGYLGGDKQYLAMKDLATGRETPITVHQLPREEWLETIVPCPKRPYILIAEDETAESWFAFREPVEIGWASSIAESLIGGSRFLLFLSLALAFLAARWT